MATRADTKALLLQVDASVELLRSNLNTGVGELTKFDRDAQRVLDRFDGRMKRVGAAGMPELSKNLNLLKTSLLGLAAGFSATSAIGAAKTFVEYADQAKQMRAQLVLATADLGSFGQAQEDVKRIAGETRIGLEATTKLYGNMLRASANLGRSQEDASRATETFSKALKIGGAGAAEAASATLQFGQALASGALRGDEFNSISEASPRILRLLADAMGVPQGELKKLAEQGKLTSDVLYKALTDTRFTGSIDAEFRELPVTFDEAMTTIRDAAVITFGAFDRGGEFSKALVNFITDGANGFQSLEDRAESFGISARGTIEGIGAAFGPVLDAGIAAFDALGIRIDQFSLDGRKEIQSLLSSLDDLDKMFGFENYTAFGQKVSGVGARYAEATARSDRVRAGEAAERRFRDMNRGLDLMGNSTRRPAPPPTTPSSASTGRKSSGSGRSISDADREANFEAAARAASDRYARARAEIASSAEERANVALEALSVEQAEYAASVEAKVKKQQLTRARADELIATDATTRELAKQRILQEQQSRAIREKLQLDQDSMRATIDMLDIQSQLAGTAAERREVELRILALQKELEKKTQQAVLDDPTSSAADRKRSTGILGSLDAKYEGRQEIARQQTAGPLESYRDSLPDTPAKIKEAVENIEVQGLVALNDGLTDAIMGAKNLGDVFKNVANQIVADLIRIVVQQTIVNSLMKALNLNGGSSGGGLLGGLIGGFFADGGRPPLGKVSVVGERGPELFVPDSAGTIISNKELAAPRLPSFAGMGNAGGTQRVVVQLDLSGDIDARIQRGAAGVAVEVVRNAAPHIRDSAVMKTSDMLRRRSL